MFFCIFIHQTLMLWIGNELKEKFDAHQKQNAALHIVTFNHNWHSKAKDKMVMLFKSWKAPQN